MFKHIEPPSRDKSQIVAQQVVSAQRKGTVSSRFVDNRPEVIKMQRIKQMAGSSMQSKQLQALQVMTNRHFLYPVQRRVHKYSKNEAKWKPGEVMREGVMPFPQEAEEGMLFNDVTGATGTEPSQVQEPLHSLAMKAGTLGAKFPLLEVEWDGLGKKLKTAYPVSITDTTDLHELGVIKFDKQEDWVWSELGSMDKLMAAGLSHGQILNFLKGFMGANGQLGYIRHQNWFTTDTDQDRWGIEIDVNYYPNRPIGEFGGLYHKDTGGNNIFVNIIFHNDTPIPATEWLYDHIDEPDEVVEYQKSLKPQALTEAIKSARKDLPAEEDVKGGVVGKHGYASWVDDLIWHATPMIGSRAEVDQAKREALANATVATSEVLNAVNKLGYIKDTLSYDEYVTHEPIYKDWQEAQWLLMWKKVYEHNKPGFLKDLENFKLNPDEKVVGERIAYDSRIADSKSISGEVKKLGRRIRSNSTTEKQNVLETHENTKTLTRSFLRTWVRVVKI